jgi:hypothetical protein
MNRGYVVPGTGKESRADGRRLWAVIAAISMVGKPHVGKTIQGMFMGTTLLKKERNGDF